VQSKRLRVHAIHLPSISSMMRHPALAMVCLSGPVVALMDVSQPSLRSAAMQVAAELVPPPVFVPADPSAKPAPTPAPPMSSEAKVPFRLVLTAKNGSLTDLPKKMADNVRRTLALNPGLQVRFLNDAECRDFIANNFERLLSVFNAGEPTGVISAERR